MRLRHHDIARLRRAAAAIAGLSHRIRPSRSASAWCRKARIKSSFLAALAGALIPNRMATTANPLPVPEPKHCGPVSCWDHVRTKVLRRAK